MKWIKGHLLCNKVLEKLQILTYTEGKELVQWITWLVTTGYPPKYTMVREMAEEIRKCYVKGINEMDMEFVLYQSINQQWVQCFLHHHPDLYTAIEKTIDASRVKEMTPEALQEWFKTLEYIIYKH